MQVTENYVSVGTSGEIIGEICGIDCRKSAWMSVTSGDHKSKERSRKYMPVLFRTINLFDFSRKIYWNTEVGYSVYVIIYKTHTHIHIYIYKEICTNIWKVYQTQSNPHSQDYINLTTLCVPTGVGLYRAHFALDLSFCWPCIIMYRNNLTNLIHFHFHNNFICLDPLHVSGVKRPSSGGTTLAVSWCELCALLAGCRLCFRYLNSF
jgi:hypothetical protein